MSRRRLFLLLFGIPGLLVYATLAVAQWRGGLALSEFKRLQEAYPPDSLHPIAPSVAARKTAVLLEASRMAPTDPEPVYQTALLNLVRAEGQSLAPKGPPGDLGNGPDRPLARLLQEGLRSVRRAIRLNPGVAEYHFVEALILQNLGGEVESAAASNVPEKAVAEILAISDCLDPYKPSLHYRIGSFQMALGNREGARSALSVALTDSYTYARPVFDLLWSSVGDVEEIRSYVSDRPLARSLLADFLWTHGYKKEAEEEYEAVASRRPIDYFTGEQLVLHSLRTREFAKARQVLTLLESRRGVWTSFQLARFQHYRGESYSLEGKYEQAIDSYERALTLDGSMVICHLDLAKTYLENHLPRKAIARWEYLLSRRADDPTVRARIGDIHSGLGAANEALGNWSQALAEYLQASAADPTNINLSRKVEEMSKRL